jgi:two-component system, LytTR family, response regulator
VTPIRTLIVDDEPLARADLCRFLGAHASIEIIGQCGNGLEALAAIRAQRPDLVFLDVQMPECDGFEVLERLGSVPPVIVFVTAYDRYALRAFEAGALDYLLKPFDATRFARTFARAMDRVTRMGAAPSPSIARIAIRSIGEVVFLRVADIDWIEAADYYACLHVGAATHILRRSLAELENELLPSGFARTHRSTIVNLARIARLTRGTEGEHEIELHDGTRLKLSRHFRRALFAHLGLRSTF